MAQIYKQGKQTFYALNDREIEEILTNCKFMWLHLQTHAAPDGWKQEDTEIVRDLPWHIGPVGGYWQEADRMCLQLDPTEGQLRSYNWAVHKLAWELNLSKFPVGEKHHATMDKDDIAPRMEARRRDIYMWAKMDVPCLRYLLSQNPRVIDSVFAPHPIHDKELRNDLHALLHTPTGPINDSPLFSFGDAQ